MKESAVEQIKDKLDILDIVKDYVPGLKRAGKTYKGCCPFHQEKTPSFTVSPDKGLFYCFGCQTGGDMFEFVMKAENLSFIEAAQKLAERAGVEWEKQEGLSEEDKKRIDARKLMDFAKQYFHKVLLSAQGNEIRGYLKSRNLTKDTTVKFELGATPPSISGLTNAALKAGFNINDLKALGLTSGYGNDYFRNRLMFPIINQRGETVGFGGRIVGQGEPKYLNSPETLLFSKSRVLYGLNFAGPAIRKDGFVLLLEGYMDVIACMQAGVENCVAPLGTAFADTHAKLLSRYTGKAVILFDPDSAGIKASLRTAMILISQGIFVSVASLGEEGLDPDEFINKYGKEAFDKKVQEAVDIVSFRADALIKGSPMSLSADEKSRIAKELLEIASHQKDPIIKAEWIKNISEKVMIPENILSRLAAQAAAPQTAAGGQTKTPPGQEKAPVFEEDLLAWLIKDPQQINLADNLTEEKFESKRIFTLLRALKAEHENAIAAEEHLVEKLTLLFPEDKDFIVKMAVCQVPKDFNAHRDITQCVNTIEKNYLEKQLRTLKEKIKKHEVGSIPEELLRLQLELQKQLNNLKYKN